MADFVATISSRWTAEETFSYLADFSNAERWDPGVLTAERLAGPQDDHQASARVNGHDDGPVRVGSRFRLLVPFFGRRLALVYRVTAISRRHSVEHQDVTFTARHPLLLARDRMTVRSNEPVSLDSVVTYQAEVSLRGPLRFLDPLLSRGFAGLGQRAANGLAEILQTELPESHPSPRSPEPPECFRLPDQPRPAS